MNRLNVILGAALQTELRALVLARGPALPAVRVLEAATGAVVPHAASPAAPAGSALASALAARGVHALHVRATGLRAATRYRIDAAAGGVAPRSVASTTLPASLPPDGLTIAVATCYYDDYHRDAALGRSLALKRWGQTPAFHIWAGDNLYMDVRADSSDYAPMKHSVERHLRYFLDSGYAAVRALAPTFTTYDDHEFWNNYPEKVAWLSRSWDGQWKGYRDAALQCLSAFQSGLNPAGVRGAYQFRIPPLSFFFLDTRSYRTRAGQAGARRMATPEGMSALRAWIAELSGPGVLVLGQPLWIEKGDWRDYNLPAFPGEYSEIWRLLRSAPYDVLVISGDVHHSRVLRIAFAGATNRHVYEFVSSPACHIPTLAATVGIGNSQDRGDLDDVPGRVEGSGESLTGRAFFGTNAQNSIGLLRFLPLGNGEVRVGATLVDCVPQDRYAKAKAIENLPRTSVAYDVCHELNLFNLRQR